MFFSVFNHLQKNTENKNNFVQNLSLQMENSKSIIDVANNLVTKKD